jgi:aldehyde:ferredoxin oxidoreductase
MTKTILPGRYFCGSCTIGCGRVVQINDGPYASVHGAGPEYETLGMLGSNCLVDNLKAISLAHQLCNQYGMDVISVGAAIAFAMECYEHGVITAQDTGGVELNWGAADALIEMVHQIGRQRGLGVLLGKGVRQAARELGGVAEEFAIHVKGLEFPAHDPRALTSTAVSYATSNRGACHLQSLSYPVELTLKPPELGFPEPVDRFADDRKGVLAAKMQNLMSLLDSLKVCKFIITGGTGVEPSNLVEWLNFVTGWDMDLGEFLLAGERISNLKRLYCVRCGVSRKDDTLASAHPGHGMSGRRRGSHLSNFGRMLNEYYQFRGWDELGRPTREKLAELGLDVKELETLNAYMRS